MDVGSPEYHKLEGVGASMLPVLMFSFKVFDNGIGFIAKS